MIKRVVTVGVAIVIVFGAAAFQAAPQPAAQSQPATSSSAPAPRPMLSPGDRAPALSIEKWVKGDSVKAFEKGKTYVVEFWATWCGPCIMSMPHMTELQKKYRDKGLTCIGVTSEDPSGNTLEAVEKLVKEKGDEQLGYTVAWDKGRSTSEAYMEAARQDGIPCAFVINADGVLAWIGHPLEMDKPLEEILAGKFDLKSFTGKFKEEQERKVAMQEASIELEPIGALLSDSKWDEVLKLLDAQIAKRPVLACDLALYKFQILFGGSKDYDAAYKLVRSLMDRGLADRHMEMHQLAYAILEGEGVEKRDTALALALSERAVKAQPENGAYLATLASAQFENKEFAKAVENQKKALEQARKDQANEYVITRFEERLKKYSDAVQSKP